MCDLVKFNSKLQTTFCEIVAPYYNAIRPTKVLFEHEKVSVFVDSLGHIEFCNLDNNLLATIDLPVSKDPSEKAHTAQYGTVRCGIDEEQICVYLPIYSWTDHYPDCDGEFDRWSRHLERWFKVIYNRETNKIAVIN